MTGTFFSVRELHAKLSSMRGPNGERIGLTLGRSGLVSDLEVNGHTFHDHACGCIAPRPDSGGMIWRDKSVSDWRTEKLRRELDETIVLARRRQLELRAERDRARDTDEEVVDIFAWDQSHPVCSVRKNEDAEDLLSVMSEPPLSAVSEHLRRKTAHEREVAEAEFAAYREKVCREEGRVEWNGEWLMPPSWDPLGLSPWLWSEVDDLPEAASTEAVRLVDGPRDSLVARVGEGVRNHRVAVLCSLSALLFGLSVLLGGLTSAATGSVLLATAVVLALTFLQMLPVATVARIHRNERKQAERARAQKMLAEPAARTLADVTCPSCAKSFALAVSPEQAELISRTSSERMEKGLRLTCSTCQAQLQVRWRAPLLAAPDRAIPQHLDVADPALRWALHSAAEQLAARRRSDQSGRS